MVSHPAQVRRKPMVMDSPMDEHLRGAWNHMETIGNPCISCSAALSGLGTARMPPDLALVDYNYLEMLIKKLLGIQQFWHTRSLFSFCHMTGAHLIFS